jgi:hypothetical protein
MEAFYLGGVDLAEEAQLGAEGRLGASSEQVNLDDQRQLEFWLSTFFNHEATDGLSRCVNDHAIWTQGGFANLNHRLASDRKGALKQLDRRITESASPQKKVHPVQAKKSTKD